ncbi:hypothetical protein [Palleronia abyssalis]|uniref:hypothetical protein n=1 Tax=Palleronia abyssalis TaxID=1501240 RepID=UPI0011B1D7F1|nr:hypothetical protein [Palleronia abyssalis]
MINEERSSLSIDKAEFAFWAVGDINSNTKRGMLAEYIVGKALGCLTEHQDAWHSSDLLYRGFAIEVKSSGFGTPPFWPTKLPPVPKFDIAERKWAWSNTTGAFVGDGTPKRHADHYVFAYTLAKEIGEFAPFHTDGWRFVVCSEQDIARSYGAQKSVSLTSLCIDHQTLAVGELKSAVDQKIRETLQ